MNEGLPVVETERPPHESDAWLDELSSDELMEIACPEVSEPREPTHREPAGALALWRAELKAGKRKVTTADALAVAACRELDGLDAKRAGMAYVASRCFAGAENVLIEAAEQKAKRARGAA